MRHRSDCTRHSPPYEGGVGGVPAVKTALHFPLTKGGSGGFRA
jgi:hypothetical protein